jgi:hypothetical protein
VSVSQKVSAKKANNKGSPGASPVDTHEPGFRFRWPEAYDFEKYACRRPFARLPKTVLCRTDSGGSIRPGLWADLPLSAKAVLIVLLRHANRENVSFPSEEVICAKSGINSRKTARAACEALQAAQLLRIEKYITMTGKRAKRYVLSRKHLSPDESEYLPSYHHHIEAGYWAMMGYRRPSAQALYWAIRFFARPRPDLEDEGWTSFDPPANNPTQQKHS